MPKVHKLELPKSTVKQPRPPGPRQWLYSRRQAAELLAVSVDTLKGFERRGRIRAVKLNGDRSMALFKRGDLLSLIGMTEKDVAAL